MRPPLRILHVTEALGGGLATALSQYMAHDDGVEQRLLAVRREGLVDDTFDRYESRVTYVRDLPALLIACGGRDAIRWADVVHVHSSKAGVGVRSLPIRRPVVYSPHGLAYLGHSVLHPRAVAARLFERALTTRTDSFGAVSKEESRELVTMGADPRRIVVVPHALSTGGLSTGGLSTADDEEAPEKVLLLGVGRLCFQKDPRLFADIFTVMTARRPECKIEAVWVGDGDPAMRAYLETAGVHVSGWLPRSETLSILQRADLLLHTAGYEGMPLTVLEAMAAGVPVVARSIAPVRELLGVATYADPEEAADLCFRMLEPAERHAAAATGAATVDRSYSYHRQAEALHQLWNSAARAHR